MISRNGGTPEPWHNHRNQVEVAVWLAARGSELDLSFLGVT
jgi:hypothetical protein